MKKLFFLAFFLLLLVISFLPVKSVFLFSPTPPPSFPLEPRTLNLEPTATPTSTPIPWKTYQNEKYYYQFSYPPHWQLSQWNLEEAANLKEPPDGSILNQTIIKGKEGHLEILVWQNKWQLPLRRWLATFRHEDLILKNIPGEENTSFSGRPAIGFLQAQTARNKPLEYLFFQKDSLIYEILMEKSYLQLDYPLYEQILSSFQIP